MDKDILKRAYELARLIEKLNIEIPRLETFRDSLLEIDLTSSSLSYTYDEGNGYWANKSFQIKVADKPYLIRMVTDMINEKQGDLRDFIIEFNAL